MIPPHLVIGSRDPTRVSYVAKRAFQEKLWEQMDPVWTTWILAHAQSFDLCSAVPGINVLLFRSKERKLFLTISLLKDGIKHYIIGKAKNRGYRIVYQGPDVSQAIAVIETTAATH